MNGSETFDQRLCRFKAKQLDLCDKLLDAAGVPEWCESTDSEVPANSVPARLAWFISRRKDVKPEEIDRQLQKDLTV